MARKLLTGCANLSRAIRCLVEEPGQIPATATTDLHHVTNAGRHPVTAETGPRPKIGGIDLHHVTGGGVRPAVEEANPAIGDIAARPEMRGKDPNPGRGGMREARRQRKNRDGKIAEKGRNKEAQVNPGNIDPAKRI